MLKKCLDICMSVLSFAFILFVVHDKTPINRFDSSLKLTLVILLKFFILKKMTSKHFPFVRRIVQEWIFYFFPIFLYKINLSLDLHILRFFPLVLSQVVNKILPGMWFLIFVLYF